MLQRLREWFRGNEPTPEPEPVTPEDVDREAGDNLYLRHLLFLRFVLGEPLTDAGLMAMQAAHAGWPLSVDDMRHVAAYWHEAEHECGA